MGVASGDRDNDSQIPEVLERAIGSSGLPRRGGLSGGGVSRQARPQLSKSLPCDQTQRARVRNSKSDLSRPKGGFAVGFSLVSAVIQKPPSFR